MSFDYKKAGVDIEAGDQLVEWLQSQEKTKNPLAKNLISGVGGFASLFRADFMGMKKPVLVTCTDGVGTKVKLASQYGRFREVAQDMVAMCVNDLVCTGGQPLLFLDYYATGKLEIEDAKEFLSGVRIACEKSNCLLVGGETAEMPGLYSGRDFDCAGFAVGVVDEDLILGAHRVRHGDVVIGVSSSGCHSNGYSLIRKIFEQDMDQWIDELLRPTVLYVNLVKKLTGESLVRACAHITGGGMENVPRVLPSGALWKRKQWSLPPLFQEIQKRSKMTHEQMHSTLNCGVGFVVICSPENKKRVEEVIAADGHTSYDLGVVEIQNGE